MITSGGPIKFSMSVCLPILVCFWETLRYTLVNYWFSIFTSISQVYRFSFRQEQLAKLTPSELIETAYLSALLEQHPHRQVKHFSHRFDIVRNFLEQIVSVVPVESIVHTIGHCEDQNIANKCTDLLMASQLELPPSLMLLHGMYNAAVAQLSGSPRNVTRENVLEIITTEAFPFSPKQSAHKLYQQHVKQSSKSTEHPSWRDHQQRSFLYSNCSRVISKNV